MCYQPLIDGSHLSTKSKYHTYHTYELPTYLGWLGTFITLTLISQSDLMVIGDKYLCINYFHRTIIIRVMPFGVCLFAWLSKCLKLPFGLVFFSFSFSFFFFCIFDFVGFLPSIIIKVMPCCRWRLVAMLPPLRRPALHFPFRPRSSRFDFPTKSTD